jgi:hypothetical protein
MKLDDLFNPNLHFEFVEFGFESLLSLFPGFPSFTLYVVIPFTPVLTTQSAVMMVPRFEISGIGKVGMTVRFGSGRRKRWRRGERGGVEDRSDIGVAGVSFMSRTIHWHRS